MTIDTASVRAFLEERHVTLAERVREFATLRMKSSNGNEFHALVHDVLTPIPSTMPEALPPRATDHPPSSR